MAENRNAPDNRAEYACIFCRSGMEERIARQIEENYPFIRALNPVKLRYRHVDGKPLEERVALFPGYIFVKLKDQDPLYQLKRSGLIYKILKDTDGNWLLTGSDRDFAEKMFETGGVFGFSQAFYENDKIHIVEGPLKDYDGQILKVNHRKRTAQVRMSVQGVQMNVWLGFELIEKGT